MFVTKHDLKNECLSLELRYEAVKGLQNRNFVLPCMRICVVLHKTSWLIIYINLFCYFYFIEMFEIWF